MAKSCIKPKTHKIIFLYLPPFLTPKMELNFSGGVIIFMACLLLARAPINQ